MADLIDRQAAIEAIHEDADWLAAQGSDWQVERMERDKSILKSLPSAQAERKTGRWIHDGKKYEAGTDWMHCSECGYKTVWAGACMTPYCPSCGAYMGGEQNGSDKQTEGD